MIRLQVSQRTAVVNCWTVKPALLRTWRSSGAYSHCQLLHSTYLPFRLGPAHLPLNIKNRAVENTFISQLTFENKNASLLKKLRFVIIYPHAVVKSL